MLDYVLLALGAGMTLGGWFWRKSVLTAGEAEESAGKKRKKVLWPRCCSWQVSGPWRRSCCS